MQGSFLPAWPLEINGFVAFSLLILSGLLGGRLAQRTGVLPRITGFIVIGFVLGPSVAGLFSHEMLAGSQVFVDIALGLILFQLGRLLDVELAWHERPLLAASVLESALSFAAIYTVLAWLGLTPIHAALAAAIGISSSPAVVLLVVKELGAKGPMTDRTLMLVALNNILSFLVFTALLPLVHYAVHKSSWTQSLLAPGYVLLISILVAVALAWLLLGLASVLPRDEMTQFVLVIGMIVGAVGLAKLLNGSSLLTLLALGLLVHNMDGKEVLLPVDFGKGAELFFVILFVVAGAKLHVGDLATAGLSAVAFVVARFLGKSIGVMALCSGEMSTRQAGLTGLTLVPMAGMAIGLTQTLTDSFPGYAETLAAIVLGAIAILETFGPVFTEYALKRSGEVDSGASVQH